MPSLDPPFRVIPTTPDELTATWLATILTRHGFSAAVEAIEFRPVVPRSLTSEMLRVVPRVQDETTGVAPALLWRRSSDDPRRRKAFELGYAAEVWLYREVAPSIDVSAPRCFAAAFDRETGAHVLLLEDLAPATPGDFVQGVSLDRAEVVLRELARLHAAHWNDPTMPRSSAADVGDPGSLGRKNPPLDLPDLVDQHAEERTRLYAHEEAGLLSSLSAGPRAFIHGNTHPASVLFPRSPTARPYLVDWQHSRVDAPLHDIARFLILALAIEDRRAHEDTLLASYLDHLRQYGIRYDSTDAARHYRAASMLQWGSAVPLLRQEASWDPDTRRATPELIRRTAAAFDDATSHGCSKSNVTLR